MIESCIVLLFICVIFMGLHQLSRVSAAREVLRHAAARAARAKTVGFNQWMVFKSARVAAIPNAGKLLVPQFVNSDPAVQLIAGMDPGPAWQAALHATPASQQYNIERARIPEFLAAENLARAENYLDYEDWDTIHVSTDAAIALPGGGAMQSPVIHATAKQKFALKVPLHTMFYADDHVDLEGECYLANHYPLYLNDMYW